MILWYEIQRPDLARHVYALGEQMSMDAVTATTQMSLCRTAQGYPSDAPVPTRVDQWRTAIHVGEMSPKLEGKVTIHWTPLT